LYYANLKVKQNKHQIAFSIIDRVLKNDSKINDQTKLVAYELLEKINIIQKDFQAALKHAQLKNEILYKQDNFESAKKISDLKGNLTLNTIKKEVQKQIEEEKYRTAIEKANKTNASLRLPTKEIKENLDIIKKHIEKECHIDKLVQNVNKMSEAIQRIETILDTFEHNKNIVFTDYLKTNEMVEFLK